MISDRFDPFVDEEALEADGLGFVTVVACAIRRFDQKFGADFVIF